MCACTAAAPCRICKESADRDWLIEMEPGPREVAEQRRYEADRQQPEDVTQR